MKIIRYTRFFLLPLIAICGFQEIPAGTRPGNQAADESPACHSVTVLPGDHDYFSLRDPLKNSRILFNRENSSRVAFLGGSITYNPGWRDQVCQYLESRYPETGFEFINAGIPSMGSTPGAFRVSRDVLSHGRVDLLFVEAAVNDASNGRSAVEQVRAMEGIVRQAWEANPAMDIVFLYFADPGKTAAYQEDKVPDVISNHEKVAEYYGISSLNLAWEVAERIEAGQFSWKQDFRDLHPSPFGQHLYAQSIKRMLAACDNYPFNQDASVTGHKLPDQLLDRDSYTNGRLANISRAEISEGWRIYKEWQPPDSASTREGFVNVPALEGTYPGEKLRFRFRGSAVGIFVAAGPDAGIVEYSIDGSPSKTRDLYTRWSGRLHLPWAHVLETGLDSSREHLLELSVLKQHNPASSGRKVRIFHFLVN